MDKKDLIEMWFKTTEEMVFFKDAEGKYLFVSDAYARLAGFDSPDEMIGKSDTEIYPSKLAQSFLAQDEQVIKTGQRTADIDFIGNKDSEDIVIEMIKLPIYDETGEIVGVQGIAKNVTETYNLKENLKNHLNLKKVIDTFPFPFWIKDKNNQYMIINQAYTDFYGISQEQAKENNVATLTINKMFDENSIENIRKHDEYTFKTQKTTKITVNAIINDNPVKLGVIKSYLSIEDEPPCIAGISYVMGS